MNACESRDEETKDDGMTDGDMSWYRFFAQPPSGTRYLSFPALSPPHHIQRTTRHLVDGKQAPLANDYSTQRRVWHLARQCNPLPLLVAEKAQEDLLLFK